MPFPSRGGYLSLMALALMLGGLGIALLTAAALLHRAQRMRHSPPTVDAAELPLCLGCLIFHRDHEMQHATWHGMAEREFDRWRTGVLPPRPRRDELYD
jgi:hypothetical protein